MPSKSPSFIARSMDGGSSDRPSQLNRMPGGKVPSGKSSRGKGKGGMAAISAGDMPATRSRISFGPPKPSIISAIMSCTMSRNSSRPLGAVNFAGVVIVLALLGVRKDGICFEMAWKRADAPSSPAFLSGWFTIAPFLKAFLICSSVAS